MKTILFVHQSAELYGSDKTLYFLVRELPKQDIRPIVVLPEEGPLAELFRELEIELIISPVIKLSRTLFSFKNLVKLLFNTFSSLYKLNKSLANEQIDIVHSNTLAVLAGAFFAKWKGIKHIWHVHEIIEKPRIINSLFRFLANTLSDFVVFNSKASLKSLVKNNEKLRSKSCIIYNGIEVPEQLPAKNEIIDFKQKYFELDQETIIIGMLGRISRWKGQSLLLEAFDKLQKENKLVHLLIIGSPPRDQEYYLSILNAEVKSKGLENKVIIHPFTPDLWKYWSCIDIAVVPSTEPEPFGLVAVEAMYAGKPVIAAKHGGLIEIIEHKQTGFLFEPNNVDELYSALKLLSNNNDLRDSLGKKSQKYAKERFTIDKYVLNFVNLYQKIK